MPDRQTDIDTECNTLHPYPGEVIEFTKPVHDW